MGAYILGSDGKFIES